MARLFHDDDVRTLDLVRDRELAVLIVLAYGEQDDIQWLVGTYGWNAVQDAVARDLQTVRSLRPSVLNLWSIISWGKPLPPPAPRDRWATVRRVDPKNGPALRANLVYRSAPRPKAA